MMSGFSLFSFDLFGIFRASGRWKTAKETEATLPEQGDVHFFGMFPVL